MTNKLIGNVKKGLIFILSAPAGTGKTTLIKKITSEYPSVVRSVSFTTRKPRSGESPGVDYHFLTKGEFEEKIAAGEFLEYVELYGDYYGTSKKWVEEQINQGKHVFLVIDTQGASLLKEKIKTISIFLKPPSYKELEKRLRNRNTETEERVEERLAWAKKEMEEERNYHYQIINDNIDTAYEVLKCIVIAEEHRLRI